MAANKNIISVLNIGAQRVGMARFKTKSGKLQLTQYETTEILADPAAASSRNSQIKMAVLELAQKMKVKNRISYAVSGQSVFTRFFTLPDLEGVNKKHVVSSEAQQHIPFPLNEVKWDWQEITEKDGEAEVVIAAIKSKVLNDMQDAVEGAGMYTTEVDPSPAALFNAFKYNYSDLDEPVMLIDIGAKTSNVIYIDGDRFFCRTIPFGGATVTTAIAKEYDVPFLEAEKQKLKNGVVALDSRHTSKMDELVAALATCIRTSLNRMPSEISRTTNFYRSQQHGNAPKRVFLAGGGANLPKLTTFLSEKLRLPVEFFNPLRTVSLHSSLDLDKLSPYAHLMGELVGLAVRRIDKGKINLELTPDSVAKEQDLDRRKSKLAYGAGLLVAGIFVFMVCQFIAGITLKESNEKLTKELAQLTPLENKMKALQAKQKNALNDVNTLIDKQSDRVLWINALDELKSIYASKKYWFTDIAPLVNYTPDSKIDKATHVISSSAFETGEVSGDIITYNKAQFINAVLIRGTWINEGHNLSVVTNQLLDKELSPKDLGILTRNAEKLQEYGESKYFSRVLQYTKSKMEPPKNRKKINPPKIEYTSFGGDKMYRIKPRWDEDRIGSDFMIVLPLKNPILINNN